MRRINQKRDDEWWGRMRDMFVEAAAAGKRVTLQEFAEMIRTPLDTVRAHAAKERWIEDADVAEATGRLVPRNSAYIAPVVESKVEEYLKNEGVADTVKKLAAKTVKLEAKQVITPLAAELRRHEYTMREAERAAVKLIRLVDLIPDDPKEARDAGITPRDAVNAIKAGVSILGSVINYQKSLLTIEETLTSTATVTETRELTPESLETATNSDLITVIERFAKTTDPVSVSKPEIPFSEVPTDDNNGGP